MTQPTLFEVPKDSPSHEERLEAFCAEKGIFTYDCDIEPDADPWIAMVLPGNAMKIPVPYEEFFATECKSDPMEFYFSYCRILDESKRVNFGRTKREAVERLCGELEIPFGLKPVSYSIL